MLEVAYLVLDNRVTIMYCWRPGYIQFECWCSIYGFICLKYCVVWAECKQGFQFVLQLLRDDEPDKYQAHFSGLVKEGFKANNLAEMYTSVHVAIHADPTAQTTE